MGDALDPQVYAEVQREARIAAEDRALIAEARLRSALKKIHDLETLVLLYRPHEADASAPAPSSNPGDSAEPRPYVGKTTWNPADGPVPYEERQSNPYNGVF